MASRSVQVHFNNNTNSIMTLKDYNLAHGTWTQDDKPPVSIAAGAQNIQWGSESDGLMTGTEGYVTYVLGSGGEVQLRWDNPYMGSNAYASAVPKGYTCTQTGGSENNANITFALQPN